MADWSISLGSLVLNGVDVIIIVLAIIGAVAGAARGFAREFSARAGFLIGFLVALLFSKVSAPLLVDTFSLPVFWATFIAFIVLFVIGYLLVMFIGSLLDRALDALHLDWLNRLLGFLLGVVEMLILVAFIIYLLELQQVIDVSVYLDPSTITTKVLRPLIPKGVEMVKELL